MRNHGVTLIELIVVVSIIGILAVALGFSYVGWQGRYKVEKTTKDLYTDLMDARTRALTQSRAYFVDFPTTTSYRVIEDTNGNNASDPGAGDNVLQSFPKTVDYTLNVALAFGLTTITFNNRGIVSPNGSINFTLPADVDPDYDCIVVFSTRINMGKMNGASCDAK